MSATPRRSNRIAGIPAPVVPPLAPRKASHPKKALRKWMTQEMDAMEKMEEIEELDVGYVTVWASSPFHMKWERLLDAAGFWTYNVSSRLLIQSVEIRERSLILVANLQEYLLPIAYNKMHCLEHQVAHLPSGQEWADEIRKELEMTRSLINSAHDALDRWIRMMREIDATLPHCDNPFYSENEPTTPPPSRHGSAL
jgi:hypothetical protein